MTVAERIKDLRKQAGLTQTELGEKLGVKKNAVSKWECGRVEDIPSSKIKAMAALFGVQPSYLIDDSWGELTISDTDPLMDAIKAGADKLNAQGKVKALDYIDDLVQSGKYEIQQMDFEEVARLREEYRKESQKEE